LPRGWLGRFPRLRFELERVEILAISARVLVAATRRGQGRAEDRTMMHRTITTITNGAAGQA
jgi:hypothetical protein